MHWDAYPHAGNNYGWGTGKLETWSEGKRSHHCNKSPAGAEVSNVTPMGKSAGKGKAMGKSTGKDKGKDKGTDTKGKEKGISKGKDKGQNKGNSTMAKGNGKDNSVAKGSGKGNTTKGTKDASAAQGKNTASNSAITHGSTAAIQGATQQVQWGEHQNNWGTQQAAAAGAGWTNAGSGLAALVPQPGGGYTQTWTTNGAGQYQLQNNVQNHVQSHAQSHVPNQLQAPQNQLYDPNQFWNQSLSTHQNLNPGQWNGQAQQVQTQAQLALPAPRQAQLALSPPPQAQLALPAPPQQSFQTSRNGNVQAWNAQNGANSNTQVVNVNAGHAAGGNVPNQSNQSGNGNKKSNTQSSTNTNGNTVRDNANNGRIRKKRTAAGVADYQTVKSALDRDNNKKSKKKGKQTEVDDQAVKISIEVMESLGQETPASGKTKSRRKSAAGNQSTGTSASTGNQRVKSAVGQSATKGKSANTQDGKTKQTKVSDHLAFSTRDSRRLVKTINNFASFVEETGAGGKAEATRKSKDKARGSNSQQNAPKTQPNQSGSAQNVKGKGSNSAQNSQQGKRANSAQPGIIILF